MVGRATLRKFTAALVGVSNPPPPPLPTPFLQVAASNRKAAPVGVSLLSVGGERDAG
jgi:hypothetical protein